MEAKKDSQGQYNCEWFQDVQKCATEMQNEAAKDLEKEKTSWNAGPRRRGKRERSESDDSNESPDPGRSRGKPCRDPKELTEGLNVDHLCDVKLRRCCQDKRRSGWQDGGSEPWQMTDDSDMLSNRFARKRGHGRGPGLSRLPEDDLGTRSLRDFLKDELPRYFAQDADKEVFFKAVDADGVAS